MPAAFGPTRPRSRAKSCRRPIRTYVGTTLPAWQPQPTNWCHGLTAESDTCRPVGQHHCAAENARSVSFFPLWPPFYDSDGPGEAWNGSVRPHWASLRPDGVRTVPTVARTVSRRWEGVKASVKMVRARRVESESSELLALTAVMTAISAMHQKAARALLRFRKSGAAG